MWMDVLASKFDTPINHDPMGASSSSEDLK